MIILGLNNSNCEVYHRESTVKVYWFFSKLSNMNVGESNSNNTDILQGCV